MKNNIIKYALWGGAAYLLYNAMNPSSTSNSAGGGSVGPGLLPEGPTRDTTASAAASTIEFTTARQSLFS